MRTARPELVRRTLLLLWGSAAALERRDAFRMAAEGGILGVCEGFGLSVVVSRLEGMADQNHTRLLVSHDKHARNKR